MTPELPLNVDSTMIVCARSCLRKFYDEFVLGYRPPGLSIDLHAGACFASAVEETYRGYWHLDLPLDRALQRAQAAFFTQWGDFIIPEFKRTAKTADRMWQAVSNPEGDEQNKGYFDVYPPQTDEIKPYFAADGRPTLEYTFAIPLEPYCHPGAYPGAGDFPEHPSGGPFIYSGRFDKLGEYQGRPIVCDEKTSGRTAGVDWARTWQLRNQFMGYVWACRQCGIDVDSVAVRGISILKEKIGHAQSIQPYSQFMLDRWYEQLRRDLWRIRKAWDERYWDYNFGDTCTSYGNCVFLDACTSPTPENWLSTMEVRRWNPLVKNPVEVKDLGNARAF